MLAQMTIPTSILIEHCVWKWALTIRETDRNNATEPELHAPITIPYTASDVGNL